MRKRILSFILAVLMLVSLLPISAFATEIDESSEEPVLSETVRNPTEEPTEEPSFEAPIVEAEAPLMDNAPVKYLDNMGVEQTYYGNCTVIDSNNQPNEWTAGWYVVDGEVDYTEGGTVTNGITVSGAVNLILKDGSSLSVKGGECAAGICVSNPYGEPNTNSLTIYAQSSGDAMGRLSASGGYCAAGIGGFDGGNGSNITINGGDVTATGELAAAGIGGGCSGSGSNITINGGKVTATGGDAGAGIGGGGEYDGSNITINGGNVTAIGGSCAAGIGGGEGGSGSGITINGGDVTATGGIAAAGIGGGKNGSGSDITINGGNVTASGGDAFEYLSAGTGIGGNDDSSNITVASSLLVKAGSTNPPGTVIAHTSEQNITSELAGKQYVTVKTPPPPVKYLDSMGVEQSTTGDYTVISSTNKPTTWNAGWYVVDGTVDYGTGGITVSGAVNLILKDGSSLSVKGAIDCAGICVSGKGNSLTIYAQSSGDTMGKLSATGGGYAAGIGGGYSGSGSNITVNGGDVTATGSQYGAGIGGGWKGNGTNITINGGNVTATGGSEGAGIGGGHNGSGSNIKVSAALLVKAGSTNPPETVIAHTSKQNITSELAGKQYVTVTPFPSVKYLDNMGVEQSTTEADTVISSANKPTTWNAGWYVVEGTVDYTEGGTVTNGITVSGEVHLILKDGSSLSVKGGQGAAGICVSGEGNSLTIYAQSTGDAMGKLRATGGQNGAGIGGGNGGSGSGITINGGTVTATGNNSSAGIGGGKNGSGSNITINGGKVTATGDFSAAGIGGGQYGGGSNISITGGTVNANGGGYAAGIGGGINGLCSNIRITGGAVNANGGFSGSCIGGNVDSNNIRVASSLIVKAGSTNPPGTVIGHTSEQDITGKLSQKRYATVKIPVARIGETKYDSVKDAIVSLGETGSGTVVLIEDVIEDIEVSGKQDVTLDLNGHVLKGTGANSVITIKGTFTLTDSDSSTVHYFKYVTDGPWTLYDGTPTENIIALSDFTLKSVSDSSKTYYIKVNGGVITGGLTKTTETKNGGGIEASLALTIKGGNIIGNNATNEGGGVIQKSNASFTMEGGTIAGNYAAEDGGGIKLGSGIFTMTGGSIIGNSAGKDSYGAVSCTNLVQLTLGGDALIAENADINGSLKNLYVISVFTVSTEKVPTEKMRICYLSPDIPGAKPVTLSGANGKDYSGSFFSDRDAYYTTLGKDNELLLSSRITEQPTEKTLKVTLTDEQLTDYASDDILYQWQKVAEKDFSQNVTIEDNQSVYNPTASDSVKGKYVSNPSGNLWLTFTTTEDVISVSFHCEGVESLIANTTDTITPDKDGIFTVFPMSVNGLYGLFLNSSDSEGITITDVKLNCTEDITGETSETLSSPVLGNSYICKISYKDGSKLFTEPFEFTHTHAWSYALKENSSDTLVATCGNSYCDYTATDTELTIRYDEDKSVAELSASTLAGLTATTFPAVKYVGIGTTDYAESATVPEAPGSYKAFIKVGTVEAYVEFRIILCSTTEIVPIGEGEHTLTLGSRNAGKVTIEKSGDKWILKNENGYLGWDGNKFAYSTTPCAWEFDGGFKVTIASSYRILWIFTKTVYTTYYLSFTEEGCFKLSTIRAQAVFTRTSATTEHKPSYKDKGDGTHSIFCSVCKADLGTAHCHYNENHRCVECGSLNMSAPNQTQQSSISIAADATNRVIQAVISLFSRWF